MADVCFVEFGSVFIAWIDIRLDWEANGIAQIGEAGGDIGIYFSSPSHVSLKLFDQPACWRW